MKYLDMINIYDEYFNARKTETFFSTDYLKDKIFYKYYSFDNEYSLNNLEKQILYCSCVENFNDPYDCFPKIDSTDFIENSFDRKSRRNSNFKKNLDNEIRNKLTDFRKNLFVGCLTDNNRSILMWSHYAKNHTGFCVAYELDQAMSLYDAVIAPVKYGKSRPKLPIYKTNAKNNLERLERNREMFRTLYHKAIEWEYESEYRAILLNDLYKNHLIENVKIKALYLGSKISKENIEKIKKTVKKIPNYKEIKIIHMILSESNYSLKEGYSYNCY